jgi:hypothetical protein
MASQTCKGQADQGGLHKEVVMLRKRSELRLESAVHTVLGLALRESDREFPNALLRD